MGRSSGKKTIEVHKQDVPWTIDDDGWFECTIQGQSVRSRSLDELITKAREAASRLKVKTDVRVTLLERKFSDDNNPARDIALTGIHGRTRDVTIRYLDGKQEADTISSFTDVYRLFTADEHKEYRAIVAACEKADRARLAFLKARKLANPTKLIEAEINKALDKDKAAS
jgi:hypothetical protein